MINLLFSVNLSNTKPNRNKVMETISKSIMCFFMLKKVKQTLGWAQ